MGGFALRVIAVSALVLLVIWIVREAGRAAVAQEARMRGSMLRLAALVVLAALIGASSFGALGPQHAHRIESAR